MTRKPTAAAERLASLADELTDRQRTYLLAVYDEDQRREVAQTRMKATGDLFDGIASEGMPGPF